ncbi:MAG: HAMP domain-containing sensor histidine kinase [Pseudomonadota bacterium]
MDRVLIVSFAATVLSFVTATMYAQSRTAVIEQAALSIQGNAAPSIRTLADARAELRRLQLLIHRALDVGLTQGGTVEIDAGRALLQEQIDDYRRLPLYAEEAAVWHRAEEALADLDLQVSAMLESMRRGDLTAARATQARIDVSSESVARALSDGISANVTAAARLADTIRQTRRRARPWAMGLDGAGVLLALFAAAVALRVARAHAAGVQRLRDLAEYRADELDLFATRLAHDIRNPLAAAKLAFEAIDRRTPEDEKTGRDTARGLRAVVQTARIVDGLLEFARSGARPRGGVRASVGEAAEHTAAVLRSRAEEAGAEIDVDVQSARLVACSEGVLASAIGNLVANAITYVEGRDTRRVAIAVVDQDAVVRVTVTDTGPGLPAGVNPDTLFDAYVRGSNARGRGLGLGLATVKRIAEAHGGTVGVHSSSAGCRFWFTLPAAD